MLGLSCLTHNQMNKPRIAVNKTPYRCVHLPCQSKTQREYHNILLHILLIWCTLMEISIAYNLCLTISNAFERKPLEEELTLPELYILRTNNKIRENVQGRMILAKVTAKWSNKP